MKKNIWILNHYATDMFFDKGGRHYWFAENLIKQGYEPIIICSSFLHKGTKNLIESSEKIKIEYSNKIPFVFLKTDSYVGNGKARIKNMFQYFWQVLRMYKKIEEEFGKPDVIIGSSVHPLACLAALIIGKKYKIKKIVEIRDLWPETLLMMGIVKEKTLLSWLLYKGEKYLYKKADNIIFTMEGGKQYIIDKGWDKEIELSKIYHINNGIDLEKFKELEKNDFKDKDLDSNNFKIIYTGTIGKANNLKKIIQVAEIMKEIDEIKFLIYGEGEEKNSLEEYCRKKEIKNVKFKGKESKERIPYILTKADILLLNGQNKIESKYNVKKYGISLNKIFDYLSAGKMIIQMFEAQYSPILKYNCGIVLKDFDNENIKNTILQIQSMERKEILKYKLNTQKCIEEFDFKKLTKKLIEIIES